MPVASLVVDLACLPASVGAARRAVDELVDRVPPPALADLRLVVSELVSNAIKHGPGAPVRLEVHVDEGGAVHGEVVDRGDGTVAIREAADDGGRGLRIVDALVARWGVRPGSTHVWFDLRAGS